jgi:predicted deacetylase
MTNASAPSPATKGPLTLVSVHDVMPETLDAVERIMEELARLNVSPITLLVVPGRDWTQPQIERLRQLTQAGGELAAHGWRHHATRMGGLYHRLHALLLSRQVAEHLALDAEGILALLQRSRDWFPAHDFPPPTLYVPPAWAMGAISRNRLNTQAPFARYELFGGIHDARTARWHPTPLLGYEADTASRVLPLRLWNQLNRARARHAKALRIGIHPRDFNLALASDLKADLEHFRQFGDYQQLTA